MPTSPSKVLVKHVGNMGDHLFLVGALLEGLARVWPAAEITLATAWGYKDALGRYGKRNSDGFCIALMKENPHVDHLVHWSDRNVSLHGRICVEEGKSYPTWNRPTWEAMRREYDIAVELDFGLDIEEQPLERVASAVGLQNVQLGAYPFYGTRRDWEIGQAVAAGFPRPRVALLENINAPNMRSWDSDKVRRLEEQFLTELGIRPLWWGANFTPLFRGRRLTLRENIAFLGACDLAIGVLGAPMHFAAAAGTQTICLYGGQPLGRAAPAQFLNPAIPDPTRHHLTIFGPTCDEPCLLKREIPCKNLTGEDRARTGFRSWQHPGRQRDKSCLAVIPVETVFAAAADVLARRNPL